jgi:hypothetical protein
MKDNLMIESAEEISIHNDIIYFGETNVYNVMIW